jgi:hypothetical protein
MASNSWNAAAHAVLTMLAGWIHREQEGIGSETGPPNKATETNTPSCPRSARNSPSPVPIRLRPPPKTLRKRGLFWEGHGERPRSLRNRRLLGGGASREQTRLRGRLPDQQGRYREFARSRAVAVAVGAEQSRISMFLGLISLQAVTGNGIATSRELSGRSRARKPAEVCTEKGKPRGQRQRHDRAVPLGMSGRKGEQNQRRRILRTDKPRPPICEMLPTR